MKYLRTFEKMGINQDLESQCEDIYKEINLPENRDINEFKFCYHSGSKHYYFELFIDKKNLSKDYKGYFSYNTITHDYSISLFNREDKGTLLHELKHLDHLMNTNNNYSGNLKKLRQQFSTPTSISNMVDQAVWIMYVYDEDEFQAKYHGYYSKLSLFIKKNLSKSPNRSEITKLVNQFLKEVDDKTYTWYMDGSNFKFSNYGVFTRDLNKLFIGLVRDNHNPSNLTYKNIFKDILNTYKWGIKDAWNNFKTKIGIITKSEQKEINLLVKKLEKDITWKRKKYNRKFRRILTIMLDKYLTTKTNQFRINHHRLPG